MPGDAIIMKICGRISKFALPVFLTISGSYDVWRLFQDFHIYIGVLEAKMLNIQIHMLLTLIVISKQLRFHDLKTF